MHAPRTHTQARARMTHARTHARTHMHTGLGVLMLFFPDDMRDYFCDPTVRKCEKLSVAHVCVSVCVYA